MNFKKRRLFFVTTGVAMSLLANIARASEVDVRSSDARFLRPKTSARANSSPAKKKIARAAKLTASHSPVVKSTASWQSLARKVGQSEEFRDRAIREVKRIPHLQAQLYRALSTEDRPLALEVIGALNLRSLLPDLLSRASGDEDGFTVLTVNALMTSKNSDQILTIWSRALANPDSVSVPVQIAMLEPMGRMSWKLPRTTLSKLAESRSPETRSSVLNYLRAMALRNGVLENLDLVTEMTRARETQVRLQAISISAEISAQPRMFRLSSVKSIDELNSLCLRESGASLKEACLSFLAVGVAVKP